MYDRFYLTTYKKDYIKKPFKKLTPVAKYQEFVDPVAEGFREYLSLEKSELTPSGVENGEEYLKKFRQKYKKVANVHFQQPLQSDLILLFRKTDRLTSEYRSRFCNTVDFDKSDSVRLPDDEDFPLTTQRASYREPCFYKKDIYKEKSIIIIPRNDPPVGNKYRECEPEVSEYMKVIGFLGDFIVKNRSRI